MSEDKLLEKRVADAMAAGRDPVTAATEYMAAKAAKKELLLPGEGRPNGEFATELGMYFSDKKVLFYKPNERQVVRLAMQAVGERKDKKVLVFQPVKSTELITLIEEHFTVGIEKHERLSNYFVTKSLSPNNAEVTLASEAQFRANLPAIERIYSVPMPLLKDGKLAFPQKGYDPGLRSWLPLDAPEIRTDMKLEDAKALIGRIYREFCFVAEQDRANAIAGLLTQFCRGLYKSETSRTPIFFFKANRERSGKDYCAGIPGIVFEGAAIEDPAISSERETHDDEFRKKVLSTLKSGRGRIHSSNNKGYINSAELERAATAEVITDRQLGSNTMLTYPNTLELSMSANTGITYTPDLAARCVFVNLQFGEEDPNDRKFETPNLHEWIAENRGDILSALYALVRNWCETGMRPGNVPFTSYHEWARVAGGIMEAAGYGSPCKPNDTSDAMGGDRETREMKVLFELAYAKWGENWINKKDIKSEFMDAESDFSGLFGWLDWSKDEGKAWLKFSRFLDKYKNIRVLSGIRMEVVEAKDHPNRNQYKWTKNMEDKRVILVGLVGQAPPSHPPCSENENNKESVEATKPAIPTTIMPITPLKEVKAALLAHPEGIKVGRYPKFLFAPESWRPILCNFMVFGGEVEEVPGKPDDIRATAIFRQENKDAEV